MFLREEKREFKQGNTYVVPFCEDCDSQDIEVVRVCKNCGSHNITIPTILGKDDPRSHRQDTFERNVCIYQCDSCGKEYDGDGKSSVISYDGEFLVGKYEDEYCDIKQYYFEEDLCYDCLKKLCNELNKEMDIINTKTHIDEVLEDIKNDIK